MKKIIPILIGLMVLFCLTCAASAEKTSFPQLGLSLEIPAEDSSLFLQSADYSDLQLGVEVYYINIAALDSYLNALEESRTGTEEEQLAAWDAYSAQLDRHYMLFGSVIGYQTDRLSEVTEEELAGGTLFGTNNAYTYYIYGEVENPLLAEEDKPMMEAARVEARQLLDTISIIDYEAAEETVDSAVPGRFSTVDMEGNTVDASVFANADLTVLHVWGTFCGPCINEMPQLAEWAKTLPKNVQLIGLIVDVSSKNDNTFAAAKKILSRSGAEFTNIIACKDMNSFLNTITSVPTTLFIDRSGRLVAEPILGAYLEEYKQVVEAFTAK